ncbi:hypothetical protein [Qipengyuania sediminis]|uniref:hypothetical protein n=1 Tax=Qipengyuania sediminis TaxID=1532023 RepID=UPI001059F718|nr:hypothetical protein [Qipengyuania sediminis]
MTAYEPAWLLFASDALITALCALLLLGLAVAAGVMDRRRQGRDRVGVPDRVGWMPWTSLSVLCAIAGLALLATSLPGLLTT